jgi:hypothetical protein
MSAKSEVAIAGAPILPSNFQQVDHTQVAFENGDALLLLDLFH